MKHRASSADRAIKLTRLMGIPWWLKTGKNLPTVQETWVQSLGREDPLGEGMATHSSILAWRTHGQRSLVGYSPKSDTTERRSREIIPPSEISQRKTNTIWHCLHMQPKKEVLPMNLLTKQKQTHRNRKQINGYRRGKVGVWGIN